MPPQTPAALLIGRKSEAFGSKLGTTHRRPDVALAFFTFRAISGLRVQGENSGFYGCSATYFCKVLESKPTADLLPRVAETRALVRR